jgi:hypothetical protein
LIVLDYELCQGGMIILGTELSRLVGCLDLSEAIYGFLEGYRQLWKNCAALETEFSAFWIRLAAFSTTNSAKLVWNRFP